VGHGFTYKRPLVCAKIPDKLGIHGFSVSGSPSDCVKIAIAELLPWKPDVVVSGLNAGDNTGIAAFYSGTVAGAREGAFWRIPSYAFSVAIGGEKHMEQYSRVSVNILKELHNLHHTDPEHTKTFFNVNFPSVEPSKARATKFTRQSLAFYKDSYEKRTTKSGESEYLLTGELVEVEKSSQFDARAISEGYITITPLSYDSTQVGVLNNMTYDAELDWHVQESLL
jgi:5'-nucleotidase